MRKICLPVCSSSKTSFWPISCKTTLVLVKAQTFPLLSVSKGARTDQIWSIDIPTNQDSRVSLWYLTLPVADEVNIETPV